VSKVSPAHLKLKFQRLLKKVFYWPPTLQLYGPPYIFNYETKSPDMRACDI
jgi:hypothetical protein